jgi:hypothetical protein
VSSIHPASFRDPSGFIFIDNGTLYRQVNPSYQVEYDTLHQSGLYTRLIELGLLITSDEVSDHPALEHDAYKILRPETAAFISYPYEWSFSQLQDAALATLTIEEIALQHGMSIKDASAYNIQFIAGKACLIDTLSFECYQEGEPWIAYRQFCQHFLAPLALAAYQDIRLGSLLRPFIDGVPIDLAAKLLPWKTRLKPGLALHIHTHASSIRRFSQRDIKSDRPQRTMGKNARLGLINSLKSTVKGLSWNPTATDWADYSTDHYSNLAHKQKRTQVDQWTQRIKPKTVWDLGANTGEYSQIASDAGAFVVSLDSDHGAVEINYRGIRDKKDATILPLVMDLTNPSPNHGWASRERSSLSDRGPADLVMALALIHHLAISNNLPLNSIAQYFVSLCQWLIIEFVPKEDPQAQKLFFSRKDIFPNYHQKAFEEEFSALFKVEESIRLENTQRILYLLKRK